MKVVVTGVNGFVGRHLGRELFNHGHTVVGVGLGPVTPEMAGVLTDYFDRDLTAGWPGVECDGVVHLAALSAVGPSFDDPQKYIAANSAPMTHMAEAILASPASPRIVVVSTGAVYGPSSEPLAEDEPTVPTSPYVMSKLVTEIQSAYYRRRGLDIVVMRPFNHIGPGQGPGFILPDLVAGVRRAHFLREDLRVGNLDTRRDYTDVRDVVRAYRLALEVPDLGHGVLNVCSGRSVSGHELLGNIARAMAVDIPQLQVDPTRLRPNDPTDVRGDNGRIHTSLGWEPVVSLEQSVRDLVKAST
ncbi:GDP-mannose 4,6-dehydratase [Nocardioides sp. LS1]|uniref:GDP-mannose 4,6-dehydratase n=1 Tax=Nocardioides sp. LS1 TaxID=1027620 RepID=UPI000FF9F869|nr:GDP-mannose 4,6-dehydratase [Nocardioides sp. LS1]GCD90655.1 GDP-mannose 4,6-dehydratase [Nocardioides sp. LS1]